MSSAAFFIGTLNRGFIDTSTIPPATLRHSGCIGILPTCMKTILSVRGLHSWPTSFQIVHRNVYLPLPFKILNLHKLFGKLTDTQLLPQHWDSDWKTKSHLKDETKEESQLLPDSVQIQREVIFTGNMTVVMYSPMFVVCPLALKSCCPCITSCQYAVYRFSFCLCCSGSKEGFCILTATSNYSSYFQLLHPVWELTQFVQ